MKSKDLTLIIVVSVVVAIFSIVLSKMFLTAPKTLTAEVEVVQEITPDFPLPDKKYFNDQSENPTRLIQIGENQTTNPFTSQQ